MNAPHQDRGMNPKQFEIRAIGHVRSVLKSLADAPRQGNEGAPRARIEIDAGVAEGLSGLREGDEVIVLSWFHLARREVLTTHPRNDPTLPLTGVFGTRSPDRPNPIGLHRVRVLAISGATAQLRWLEVEPLEAIDGTPIIDIKPVLSTADH